MEDGRSDFANGQPGIAIISPHLNEKNQSPEKRKKKSQNMAKSKRKPKKSTKKKVVHFKISLAQILKNIPKSAFCKKKMKKTKKGKPKGKKAKTKSKKD